MTESQKQFSYTSQEIDDLLRDMNENSQLKYMAQWFSFFYEDPAEETPLDNESEYGYAFISGGPFYAEDELRERFETTVEESAILTLLDELAGLGNVWAPTYENPHHINNQTDDEDDEPEPPPPSKFQIYRGAGSKWYWAFLLEPDIIIAVGGEPHDTKQECYTDINLVKFSEDDLIEELS